MSATNTYRRIFTMYNAKNSVKYYFMYFFPCGRFCDSVHMVEQKIEDWVVKEIMQGHS